VLEWVSDLFYDPRVFWGVPLAVAVLRRAWQRVLSRTRR